MRIIPWHLPCDFAVCLFGLLAQLAFGADKAERPVKVLCSFYPMYVMALNVVANTPGVEVECLTQPVVGCLHDYQLTPADLKTIGSADIFIANGAGMESFLEKALQQSPRLKIVEASKGLELIDENPHVWVSV